MSINFTPSYTLLLSQTGGRVWSLSTIHTLSSFLPTGSGASGGNTGQMSVVLTDADGYIRTTVRPRAMNLIQLKLTNRFDQSAIAWTGYVDSVHQSFDPTQGNLVTLSCTSPVKLFTITRQTPADFAALTWAYNNNVTGSAVLGHIADICGYPRSMLALHPIADSGSGLQSSPAGYLSNPQQQPWTAVISPMQAQSGIEWFFSEEGICYWRQLNFITPWFKNGPQKTPSVILPEDIIQADYIESDRDIVTRIEVRWAQSGNFQAPFSAGYWTPPPAIRDRMETHLRKRVLTVYAPWIGTSSGKATTSPTNGQAAATYLAQILGQQYSAGVLTAIVTIPADPTIKIGSIVQVPSLGDGGVSHYYVSSVSYQLQWGASWVMTLTLAYGHAPGNTFPYVQNVAFPIPSTAAQSGFPVYTFIPDTPNALANPQNATFDSTPYTIVPVQNNIGIINVLEKLVTTATDAYSADLIPGITIQLKTQPSGGGSFIGKASEYIVKTPPLNLLKKGQIGILAQPGVHAGPGYVTFLTGTADSGATTNTNLGAQGPPGYQSPIGYTAAATGTPAYINPALTVSAQAFNAAVRSCANQPYVDSHAGENDWDCSGMIAWAYYHVGGCTAGPAHQALFNPNRYGPNVNGDNGPDGIFYYFNGLGCPEIPVASAQLADLLFWYRPGDGQRGFSHVGFALGDGRTSFAALSPEFGIGLSGIQYPSVTGASCTRALHMSGLTRGMVR